MGLFKKKLLKDKEKHLATQNKNNGTQAFSFAVNNVKPIINLPDIYCTLKIVEERLYELNSVL